MNTLFLENITKGYTNMSFPVLKSVSFNFRAGCSYAITGKSGIGKTTLLNIIATMIRPDEGRMLFNDTDLLSCREKEIAVFRNKVIGYIAQGSNIINDITAEENIEIPLYYSGRRFNHNERKKRILSVASALEIETLLQQTAGKLSGGERKRVAIARALINAPLIVAADEPTEGLDAETKEVVLNSLFRKAHSERILIVATHDKAVAEKCDVILQIKNGELVRV